MGGTEEGRGEDGEREGREGEKGATKQTRCWGAIKLSTIKHCYELELQNG